MPLRILVPAMDVLVELEQSFAFSSPRYEEDHCLYRTRQRKLQHFDNLPKIVRGVLPYLFMSVCFECLFECLFESPVPSDRKRVIQMVIYSRASYSNTTTYDCSTPDYHTKYDDSIQDQ